jgi:XTP/dITP diphosphohydrolase
MELLLASGNRHKKKELSAIFAPHILYLPEEKGVSYEFEETGKTFLENALGKAFALFDVLESRGGNTSIPKTSVLPILSVLSDDSGLMVDGLGGAPGVYSARYGAPEAGPRLSAEERNRYLLSQMEGLKGEERKARFVCSMVLILERHRFLTVQETVEGRIIEGPRGTKGFGYDPVFFLDELGKTAAELEEGEKNAISHRGRAAKRLFHCIDHPD